MTDLEQIEQTEKRIACEQERLQGLRNAYKNNQVAKGIIKEAKRENFLISSTRKLYQECHEIIVKKNHDYAGIENEWKNFETVKRINISVQKGIFIRFLDKVTRLENLLFASDKPYVTDEPIDDTIKDAINYLGILYARRQMELGEQSCGGIGSNSPERRHTVAATDVGKNYNFGPYVVDQESSTKEINTPRPLTSEEFWNR